MENVHQHHIYSREVTLSKETFEKYRKKKIRRFSIKAIVGAWYKVEGSTTLYRENGEYVDQLIFQQDNLHYKLQGYVFRG